MQTDKLLVRDDVRPWCEATTIGDLLLRAAHESPDVEALVFPGERLSYAELAERAKELSLGLVAAGVQRGDRVGILMPNSPDCVAAMFAVSLMGGVFVPINIRYRAVELPFLVRDAELTAILTSDRIDDYVDLVGLLSEALPDLVTAENPEQLDLEAAPRLGSVVVLGSGDRSGTVREEDFLNRGRTVPAALLEVLRTRVRLREIALLLYTSGTTSLPRGCMLTHEAIVRNWTLVGQILDVNRGDRFWAPCPMFHLAAIGPILACVSASATLLSDTYFEPGRALALTEAERATHLYPAYPPITQGLMDDPAFADADLSSARVMLNVAPPDTLRQMQEAFPQVVQVSLYGSTEGGGAITYNSLSDDLDTRVSTCGTPLPGTEVRVVDPVSGAPVPDDTQGEIQVRGFGLFEGYANDPEKTQAAFTDDAWYRTGDRGSVDAAGRLRFYGRLKEMLKVGGENVAPAEIEALLATHPAVKLVQVVGVPDARLDEVPAAFVELRAQQTATEDDLVEFCRGQIASFKLPRHVRIVTDWPMSATKIQKGTLRESLLEELAMQTTSG